MRSRGNAARIETVRGEALSHLLAGFAHDELVPRVQELMALEQAFAMTVHHAQVVYVYGSGGTGKSALLQSFLALPNGTNFDCALVDLQRGYGQVAILTALTTALLGGGAAGPMSAEEAVYHINGAGARGGFILALDAYDTVGEHEHWLRESILERLGPGVLAVLAGRTPPVQLWWNDRAWRRFVQPLEVGDLNFGEAKSLLAAHGVLDEVAQEEAYAVSSGRPEFLIRAAETFGAESGGFQAAGAPVLMEAAYRRRLTSFFVERVLHPGSQRGAWRAGRGSDNFDRVLAVASVLPSFRRDVLCRLAGDAAVAQVWNDIVALPGVVRTKSRYAFPSPFRARLRDIVRTEWPWQSRAWRSAAVRYHLEQARTQHLHDELGEDWGQISRLSEQSVWFRRLNPEAEESHNWSFSFGIRDRDDVDALVACRRSVAPDDGHEALRELAASAPDNFLVARDGGGQPVGYLVAAPGPGVPQAWHAGAERTLGANVLVLFHSGAAQPGDGVELALLRTVMESVPPFERVLPVGDGFWAPALAESWREVLPLLRFELPRGDVPAGLLDLEAGFPDWLQRVVAATGCSLDPAEWAVAAEEALQHINDIPRLADSQVAEFYRAVYGPSEVTEIRSWLVDALRSVRTNEVGRRILQLYYVDRAGSHEDIAQRLDLPRSTYFRLRTQAISAVAGGLFLFP